MTIYVSRSWPAIGSPVAAYPGQHPHSAGRGSGNFYRYPDEMWAAAKETYRSLQVNLAAVAPGVEVKCEWVRGYPEGFCLLEGAFCALDDKPEDIVPDFKLRRGETRKAIDVSQAELSAMAA